MSRKTAGWDHVDRQSFAGAGRFVDLKPDTEVVMRVLDDAPVTFHQHRISYKDPETGKDQFGVIPATKDPDEDWVDQQTSRYPAEPRHAIRVVVYDDDGKPDRIAVLVGGVTIFRPLKKLFERHGSLSTFDIVVAREGEGIKTKYEVTADPDRRVIDVEEWYDKMEGQPEFSYDALFPDVTPEDQKRMAQESGLDLQYDPIADRLEAMDESEASQVRFSFGKYGPDNFPKGKLIREVAIMDPGYVSWVAEKATSDVEVAAAARFYQNKLSAAGDDPAVLANPDTKKKAAAAKASGVLPDWPLQQEPELYLARWFGRGGKHVDLAQQHLEARGYEWDATTGEAVPIGEAVEPTDPVVEEEAQENRDPLGDVAPDEDAEEGNEEAEEDAPDEDGDGDMSREELVAACKGIFKESFSDAQEIVRTIKEHGGGKTRLDDMSVEQLTALYGDIVLR